MGFVPFAFSVHQIVSSVGADVGFAAIVGLAILVLLYFAQARETANLRDQAYDAVQRVEQLEARVAQVARRQPAPAPAPQGAAAAGVGSPRVVPPPVPLGAVARTAVPGAPAGVGAPALAAATRLIPSAVPAFSQSSPAAPTVTPAPALEPERVGEPAPVPAGGGGGAQVPYAAPVPELAHAESAAITPATFAGTGNGAPRDHRADAAMASAPPPRVVQRPPIRTISATPPRRPLLAEEEPVRRSRLWLAVALLVGAAAAAAVVLALVHFTSAGASPHASSPPQTSTAAPHGSTHGTTINPSSVTVAVLNGTSTPGLALRTATRLTKLGFRQGRRADAKQTYTTSVVEYMPGHRPGAAAVARALKLKPSAVQKLDPTTQPVACPQTPCSATVVVITGADLASQ